MPVPPNTTSATAIDITSLPYDVVQDVHDAGTAYDVWYKHTAAVDGEIGLWGLGSANLTTYRPTVSVYITNPAGAAYLSYQNRPVQFWTVAGTTYYFKFATNSAVANPAVLTLNVQLHQSQTAPAGSIAVCDTVNTYPFAILPPDQDYTVLQFIQRQTPSNVTATEYGADILPNGIVAIADSVELELWDAAYNNVAFVTNPLGESIVNVTTNRSDRFYFASGHPFAVSPAEVSSCDDAGTLGGTIWTLDETDVCGIAVDPTETILYYVTNAANAPVKRWDLVNDVALSNLAAGINAQTHALIGILCHSDGTVFVGYRNSTAGTEFVRHYSAAGATLHTYSLDYSTSYEEDLLATNNDEDSIWVWQHDGLTSNSTMYFNQIQVSDGTILNRVTGASFDAGRYLYSETLTPLARFGFSKSCPFWITRSGSSPEPDINGPDALDEMEGGETTVNGTMGDYRLVWVRRAPHLADEQQRIFYRKFQLDLEAGVGLSMAQGSTPACELRWSNDGGFTWSGYRQLGMGPQGEYRYRAIGYQLGMARDRVFEVRGSDPVKTALIDAYLDVEEGAS